MKKLAYALCLMLILGLVGCGGDEVADTNQSAEGKAITEEVGGPFDLDEFEKFLKDLPSVAALTGAGQQAMGQEMDPVAMRAKVVDTVTDLGWSEERFMYVYSHAMSVMSLEQMDKMNEQMEAQMEGMPEAQKKMMEQMLAEQMGGQMEAVKAEVNAQVPASEQAIIRDHLGDLEKAFGVPQM